MTFRKQTEYIDYLKNKPISLEKKVYWSGEYLENKLGKGYQIVSPRMPLPENAKYSDWKILFERYLTLLTGEVILIGSSLGGIFLAKYLSENKLPKPILSVYLICPPFDNSHSDEELLGGFSLKKDLSLIEKNTRNLHLLFSADDESVPVYHAERYREKLPNSHLVIYKSKNGHFRITKFPEIVRMIKNDTAKIIQNSTRF